MRRTLICGLLIILSHPTGCESGRFASDERTETQFEKQLIRARECRDMQNKLSADQTLTPTRAAEITKEMEKAGCQARLPGP
jgi:hypothetical protein